MREILFRGKQLHTNNWVFGDLFQWKHFNGKSFQKQFAINAQGFGTGQSLIIPETIGQYTGLKDKNGKMIFEGDLFTIGAEKETFEVVYESGCFLAYCNGKQYGLLGELMMCFVEIIGNIHDNPELITNPK